MEFLLKIKVWRCVHWRTAGGISRKPAACMFNSRMSSKRCVSLNARFGIPIDRTPHASSSDTSRAYRRNRSKMSANLVLAASAARKLNICAKRRSRSVSPTISALRNASANVSRINTRASRSISENASSARSISTSARVIAVHSPPSLGRVNSRSMDSETSRKCFVARARAF